MAYDSQGENAKLEEKEFDFIKDLTILSGTIFGLSVAITSGKDPNIRFIIGEFLLFLSMILGLIILYSSFRGQQFFHFMMTKSDLEIKLPKRTGGVEDFIVDSMEDLIKSYDTLMKKSQKSPLNILLRLIKIDYFYNIFFIAFALGVFSIFLSIINFSHLLF